ncbi:MAG: response regulator transcription factor [Bacteroidia bacterium]
MSRILLIEDDMSFGYILTEYLTLHDFQVEWAKSAQEGLETASQFSFDLGIFDVMLPDQSGYELATELKKQYPELPFIFLSAKSLKIDKLKGYKVGADDFITKPVDEELLLAKIRALLLRAQPNLPKVNQFQIGAFQFDASIQSLAFGDSEVQLTKREAALLRLLCLHKDQLLSRNKALKEIWGAQDEFSRKSMDVFLSHLRKHLSLDPRVEIKNVHGKGFIFQVHE